MINNSINRLHSVFFYGLYMDPTILQQCKVEPRAAKIASAKGYQLRIGHKATLLRKPDAVAHGIVYSLTHAEINALYQGAGLTEYVAEAILVESNGETFAALCCNLLSPPAEDESSPEYTQKLITTMIKLDVPVTFA